MFDTSESRESSRDDSDEDPDMRAALQRLHARLQVVRAIQARTLEAIVERLLETSYP
jgi:hypothetical protein